jgi:hypothetical protein
MRSPTLRLQRDVHSHGGRAQRTVQPFPRTSPSSLFMERNLTRPTHRVIMLLLFLALGVLLYPPIYWVVIPSSRCVVSGGTGFLRGRETGHPCFDCNPRTYQRGVHCALRLQRGAKSTLLCTSAVRGLQPRIHPSWRQPFVAQKSFLAEMLQTPSFHPTQRSRASHTTTRKVLVLLQYCLWR